ncbi:hypothetical protein HBB16_10975 [Pseudonocardia sp. MCCB 268]|nr:hypothetical protein [Pseudonocardia cytotoxica]
MTGLPRSAHRGRPDAVRGVHRGDGQGTPPACWRSSPPALTALARFSDVGGGNGTLLAAFLAARPELRGVLFDTATASGRRHRLRRRR